MKVTVFDIETGSVDDLHDVPNPDYPVNRPYVRLCGWMDPDDPDSYRASTNPAKLLDALYASDRIVGHNIIGFDLLALARHNGADYDRLTACALDTMLVERHLVPVAAKGMQPRGFYGLDASANRRCGFGKSDDLKALAKKHGGFDRIPQDDPEYRAYLEGDVRANAALYLAQKKAMAERLSTMTAEGARVFAGYLASEHETEADMGRITIEGFRADRAEVEKRNLAGIARLDAARTRLHEKYGMPVDGRYPHRTNPGKAAFRKALLDTGVQEDVLDAEWPLAKDGSLKTGKDVLNRFIPVFESVGNTEAVELCRTILAFNGERTIYQTIWDHLHDDGDRGFRVHPYIGADQGSGRWSMKNPGLTVLGKRGGKAVERAVLLADEGDVLVAIDADQVDARAVAGLSQDTEYMKLFLPGTDLHSEVALRVFNRPECRAEMARNNGRCDCEYRDKAKVFGHGWNYGMQPNTMARQHGVDVAVARQFDRGMKEGFRRLAQWQDENRKAAGALGYGEEAPEGDEYRILYTGFGRPVRVERNRAFTQATAMIGQGTTRDIMAYAIRRLPGKVRRKIKAVIHDEIVVSIPATSDAQDVAQAIADSMAFDFRPVGKPDAMPVRITFGCSRVSDCWGGAYGEQYCPHVAA